MDKNAIIKGCITNLGKYNEGVLSYKMISFPIDDDELNEALKEIGCMYTDEEGEEHNINYAEYFFSDWECDIPFDLGEYVSIGVVNEIAERVEALSAFEQDVLEAILAEYTNNAEYALQIVEDGNYTTWDGCCSMADVAEVMADKYNYLNDIPEPLKYYIDYESWGRDIAKEGTFIEGANYILELY